MSDGDNDGYGDGLGHNRYGQIIDGFAADEYRLWRGWKIEGNTVERV